MGLKGIRGTNQEWRRDDPGNGRNAPLSGNVKLSKKLDTSPSLIPAGSK